MLVSAHCLAVVAVNKMVYNLAIAKLVGRRGDPSIAADGCKRLTTLFAIIDQYAVAGACCGAAGRVRRDAD